MENVLMCGVSSSGLRRDLSRGASTSKASPSFCLSAGRGSSEWWAGSGVEKK